MNSRTLCCFAAITISSFSANAAEICLKTESRPAGPLVTLGDVADVRDVHPARAEKLAKLALFPAPAREKLLRQTELEELLTLASIDVTTCRFSGEAAVTIQAAGHGRPSLPASAKPATGAANRGKRTAAPAVLVLTTTRPLRKGELIRPADVELKPASGSAPAALTQLEDVVGKETTRALATGQMLESECLRSPRLVQRGDAVRVIARAAGVRVKTNGRAMQDGGHGDVIEIQPLEGKQRYMARVVDFQQVEVYAQGPSAQ